MSKIASLSPGRFRLLALCLVAAALAWHGGGAAIAAQSSKPIPDGAGTMRVEEIRVGMKGVGYTVMRGWEPERFEVEILGVVADQFPKHDLIIARLSGLGLERSGVIAGMSGSPVLIEDRVIGAVAYRLVSFGHEAIAGIIPIESMLKMAAVAANGESRVVSGPGGAAEILHAAALRLTGELKSSGLPGSMSGSGEGLRPIATPLSFAGWRPELVGKLGPLFESLGWTPVAGGASGSATGVVPYLSPGGAVAVQLVRGDINVNASGTITYRDGDRILAFGHPFLQGGAVDFPMVASEVITVLSSSSASSKLSVSGRDVLGAVRQDRLAGIMGVIGVRPSLIPVRVQLDIGNGTEDALEFELVSDKILTPLYLFLGLVNGVQSLDQVYGEGSIELDAEIFLGNGLESVRFDNLFASQNQAIIGLSSTLAAIFGFLYDNSFEPVEVREIDVAIKLRNDRKTATISRVWYDRTDVHPGDTVNISVALQPYRQPEIIERLAVRIPTGLSPGPLTLIVGDANAVSQEEASFIQGAVQPRDMQHLVRLLNSIRRSDRIYVQGSRSGAGALLGGEVMPALPPSLMQVLESRQSSGDFVRLQRTVIIEDDKPVEYVVRGSHRIQLNVRSR